MSDSADSPAPEIVWPSVDVSQPTEQGGPIARSGFSYQDEIVVGFLLEMLEDASVLKVHCDTHEDAIVIRLTENSETLVAEYAQVKAEEPDRLWTVAMLSDKKKKTQSLFETSLGRDKHAENARFRIVTLRQPEKTLKPLTFSLESEERARTEPNKGSGPRTRSAETGFCALPGSILQMAQFWTFPPLSPRT